jgi:Collagen triple helix repeat (20 copies)
MAKRGGRQMGKRVRRHLSYANVAATLALVFAMSGGALAATHYLINSTRQINPKVIKALKGRAGTTGATGLQGKEGPQGKEGKPGADGTQGKEGPEGPGAIELDRGMGAATTEILAEIEGLKLTGSCDATGKEATITVEGSSPGYALEMAGTANHDGEVKAVDKHPFLAIPEHVSGTTADLDVIAQTSQYAVPSSPLVRIDVHGEGENGGYCFFYGMVIL